MTKFTDSTVFLKTQVSDLKMCKLEAGEKAWVKVLGALVIPSQHPLAAHNLP